MFDNTAALPCKHYPPVMLFLQTRIRLLDGNHDKINIMYLYTYKKVE